MLTGSNPTCTPILISHKIIKKPTVAKITFKTSNSQKNLFPCLYMIPLLSSQVCNTLPNSSSIKTQKEQVEETYSTTDEQKVVEVKVDLIKGIHDAAMIRNAKIVTAVNLFLLSEIIPQNEDSAISHERQYAMQKFCTRILSLTKSSRSVIFVSLLYVYRLTTLSSMNSAHMTLFASVQALGLKLTPRQLMTVTLMLAYKYLEDRKFSATAWAKISSIDVNELNSVERECLAALQFNLYVSEQEFLDWKTWLYQFVTRMENQ